MPPPEEVILGGDLLLIQGRPEDLDVLRGLQELQVEDRVSPNLNIFESDRLALLKPTLAPQSPLAGKPWPRSTFTTLWAGVVAVWRSGTAIRTNLDKLTLHRRRAAIWSDPGRSLRSS